MHVEDSSSFATIMKRGDIVSEGCALVASRIRISKMCLNWFQTNCRSRDGMRKRMREESKKRTKTVHCTRHRETIAVRIAGDKNRGKRKEKENQLTGTRTQNEILGECQDLHYKEDKDLRTTAAGRQGGRSAGRQGGMTATRVRGETCMASEEQARQRYVLPSPGDDSISQLDRLRQVSKAMQSKGLH